MLAVSPTLHAVKVRLGHESIKTTVDLYGHLVPSVDAGLSDGLGEMFESAPAEPTAEPNVVELRP